MPQNAKAYSSKLYDAIELAARAHHNQVRKGTEIPYIVHPLAVAGWLIRAQCPETLVIAALLHDVLEDTPLTIEELRFHFGREVVELVTALSEPDKKAPWEERKTHTIEYLEKQANDDVLLIAWPTNWTMCAPSARALRATVSGFGNGSTGRGKNSNGIMSGWMKSSRQGSIPSRRWRCCRHLRPKSAKSSKGKRNKG